MKLYYSPGACCQAPHILLHEIGIDHDAVRVDLKTKTLEDGSDYLAKNPKGSVPALELDNGEVLTENAVILQYLGDRAGSDEALPARRPFPPLSRARAGQFHHHRAAQALRPSVQPRGGRRNQGAGSGGAWDRSSTILPSKLGEGPFLLGDTLTIADPYLFVIARWTDKVIGIERWPNLAAFHERMQRAALGSPRAGASKDC